MALLPVTPSIPINRAVTGEHEQRPATEATPQTRETSSSGDTVTLSDEARRLLAQDSKIQSSDDARKAAGNVKKELASNADLTLGLKGSDF